MRKEEKNFYVMVQIILTIFLTCFYYICTKYCKINYFKCRVLDLRSKIIQ